MSTTNSDDPALELDEPSLECWHAYGAMFESKQSHYDFLQILEDKKKNFNLSPSESDTEKLANLLAEHDVHVKRFVSLSQKLKNDKPESHVKLFEFIGKLGDAKPNEKVKH